MFDQSQFKDKPLTGKELRYSGIALCVFLTLMLLEIFNQFEPRKLGALLIPVFWIPLLFLHEFAHAVTAKVLGWKAKRIVIGFGRVLIRTRFLGIPMEIRAVPLEGFVSIAPENKRYSRIKNALIYFAGPGIELLLFFIILSVIGTEVFFEFSDDYPHIVFKSLAYAALAGAIINLIPMGITTKDGTTPNDGLGILLSLFSRSEGSSQP